MELKTVNGTLLFLFLLSPVVWNMCEYLYYEAVSVSKSYTMTKNTIDRQYTKRGQL